MSNLTIKVPGAPLAEANLAPGRHQVGRSANNDLQISDASISGAHCQITVTDQGGWGIKDLGSTNGTFIDGQRVREGLFGPGQILRLGEVELTWPSSQPGKAALTEERAVAAPPPASARLLATETAPPAQSPPALKRSARKRGVKGFYRCLPGAFLAPFRNQGWGLLLAGALIYGLVGVLPMLIGCVFLMTGGYLFLFLQDIVRQTAAGEDDVFLWPDFEDWWESGLRPMLLGAAVYLASMCPMMLYVVCIPHPVKWVTLAWFGVGILYLPMSMLAVSVYDSAFAVNPALTFPAIARAPVAYGVCCLILGGMCVGIYWLNGEVRRVMPGDIGAVFLSAFLLLYTLCVEMRILGLFYQTNKERFGWKLTG